MPRPVEYLAAHRLFGVLPAYVFADVADRISERQYARFHRLCYAGDPPAFVVVIASGMVGVITGDERGNEYITLTYSAGDVFGLAPVLLDRPSASTTVALVETRALLVPKDTFKALCQAHPELSREVTAELYAVIQRSKRATASRTLTSVPARLASFLLDLAVIDGSGQVQPAVAFPFSHQDLALLLGTTRESVCRTLSRLVRTGVITLDGHTVSLTQPDALRRIAAG